MKHRNPKGEETLHHCYNILNLAPTITITFAADSRYGCQIVSFQSSFPSNTISMDQNTFVHNLEDNSSLLQIAIATSH